MSGTDAPSRGMSGHEEFDELAAAHVLHALEPDEDRAFLEHADDCALCRDVLSELTVVAANLAGGVAAIEPPPRLRDSILAAAAGPAGRPPERMPESRSGGARASRAGSRRRHRRPDPVRALIAVMAVVVALALVGGLVAWGAIESGRAADRQTALRQRDAQLQQRDAQLEQRNALLAGLVGPGTRTVSLSPKQGAGAEVVIAGPRVRVVTAGLTANDPARATYVLWAINAAGTPVGVRAFDVDSRSVTLVDVGTVAPAVAGAKGFAISLEPGRTVPAAPTDIVLS